MRKVNSRKWYVRAFAIALVAALTLSLSAPEAAQAATGKVKSVTVTNLPAKTLKLEKGKSKTLKVKVTTSGKKVSKAVTYKSSKKSVAAVTSKGKVTAKKNGKANITVTSKVDKKKKVTIKVTVVTPVTKVKLSKTKATLSVGKKLTLKATVSPKNPSNKKVVWTTSKKSVATVSSKGVVTAKKAGTAKITAKAADGSGKKATCTVTVKTAVKKVALNKKSATITAGDTLALKATVTPKNASNKTLKWSSSAKKVATVDEKGVVTAVATGTATITAKATDGSGKKASCTVTVIDANVTVSNPRTIDIAFTAPVDPAAISFVIKSKDTAKGEYVKTYAIEGVTSADQTYTIKLKSDGPEIQEGDLVQVTVKGISDMEGDLVKEVEYSEGVSAYDNDRIWPYELKEYGRCEVDRTTYFGTPVGGYASATVDALPPGISTEAVEDGIRFYGNLTQPGVFVSTVTAKDEAGNTFTRTITWLVGNEMTPVYAAASPEYFVTEPGGAVQFNVNDDQEWLSGKITAIGGKEPYTYKVVGGDIQFAEKNGKYLSNELYPGTHQAIVQVTDKNGVSAQVAYTVEVRVGKVVSGTVRDALGNGLSGVYVTLTDKNKADHYPVTALPPTGRLTDAYGRYAFYVTDGTYDIEASLNGAVSYLDDQVINGAVSGKDIELELYPVYINADDSALNMEGGWNWIDASGYYGDVSLGSGHILHLKEGNYTLYSKDNIYEDKKDVLQKEDGRKLYKYSKYDASVTVTVAPQGDNNAVATTLVKDSGHFENEDEAMAYWGLDE